MTDAPINFEKHIPITHGNSTAISWLSEKCPQLSKQKLKFAMQAGAVWLTSKKSTNRIRRAKKNLSQGDELHIYYSQDILEADVEPAKLVADEGHFSVWNKPHGMYSQGTKWGDHSAICRWVELNAFQQRQSYLVHRLDRATRGLIIVAHSKNACRQLTMLFEKRQVEKIYRATVHGKFPLSNDEFEICSSVNEKEAVSKVLSADYDEAQEQSHLKIKIETGRKHQIRIHLSQLGFPVVGDRLYGRESDRQQRSTLQNLQLESYKMSFVDPLSGEQKAFHV